MEQKPVKQEGPLTPNQEVKTQSCTLVQHLQDIHLLKMWQVTPTDSSKPNMIGEGQIASLNPQLLQIWYSTVFSTLCIYYVWPLVLQITSICFGFAEANTAGIFVQWSIRVCSVIIPTFSMQRTTRFPRTYLVNVMFSLAWLPDTDPVQTKGGFRKRRVFSPCTICTKFDHWTQTSNVPTAC